MELPVWTVLLVALIPAVGTWVYNRHKPRVDNSAEQRGWFNEVQEERDKAVARADREAARADACEEKHREARTERDDLLRENGALRHELDSMEAYLKATLAGVAAGTIPPWLTAPYVLHHRLPPEAMPDWALSPRHDTGVPGVDLIPRPPDDGQDTDPTT